VRITLALMLIILAFAFSCKDNPGTGPREIYTVKIYVKDVR